MTFTEAAAEVLRLAGKPLHYKEITELAIEKNLLSHVGKSPDVTMGARLAALLKKDDKSNPILRVKPGVFALRDWDEKKADSAKPKAAESTTTATEPEIDADGAADVNALEVEAVAERAKHPEPKDAQPELPFDGEPEEAAPKAITGEDALRADLAAQGADLFDDEDDDDQPILAQPGAPPAEAGEGGRRRRRRRRRGRGGAQAEASGERPSAARVDAPAATSPSQSNLASDEEGSTDTPREVPAPSPRPLVRERHQIMAGGSPTGIEVPLAEGEELLGRDLADAAVVVLGSFDRNAGPVPVRAVVDALMRRGRLGGDPAAASLQLSAALRADNLRRAASSQRARFRFSNGSRVALTDWALGADLLRLEQDVIASIERYRDGARRVLLRRLQELPGHAFVELVLVALERVGMAGIKPIRRAGSPGGEAHFAAVHKTGSDEIRTAIIVRKDGREIGRERVTDLRGALHHYGNATGGWLITTGQVLSGAREESAAGASPVALYDGLGFARLLEDNDVGVLRTRFPVAIVDLELFDALRA